MEIAGRKICPSCGYSNPANAALCNQCGKEIFLRKYEIVPDGGRFAIRFQREIKIHGLELERARYIVSILNSVDVDVA